MFDIDKVEIFGSFIMEEVKDLVDLLNFGVFFVKMKEVYLIFVGV